MSEPTFFEKVAEVKQLLEEINREEPELHQIIPHAEVVRQRETLDLVIKLGRPSKNFKWGEI